MCCTIHVINARAIDVSRCANIWSPNDIVSVENISSTSSGTFIAWFLIGDVIATRDIFKSIRFFRFSRNPYIYANDTFINNGFRFEYFLHERVFYSETFCKLRSEIFFIFAVLYSLYMSSNNRVLLELRFLYNRLFYKFHHCFYDVNFRNHWYNFRRTIFD